MLGVMAMTFLHINFMGADWPDIQGRNLIRVIFHSECIPDLRRASFHHHVYPCLQYLCHQDLFHPRLRYHIISVNSLTTRTRID